MRKLKNPLCIFLAILMILSLFTFVSATEAEPEDPVADLDPALQVWYKMDEGSGRVLKDATGNHADATLEGLAERAYLLADGSGLQFDRLNATSTATASAGWVTLPRTLFRDVPDDFTISFDIFFTAGNEWTRIFDFGPGDGNNVMFMTAPAMMFRMDNVNDLQPPSSLSNTNNTNVWRNVVITREGDRTSMYINGFPVGSSTYDTSNNRMPTTGQFYLGRANWTDPYTTMRLSDFRIYSRAMSMEEVMEKNDVDATDFLTLDAAALSLPLMTSSNLNFAERGMYASDIVWKSSDTSIISNTGVVNPAEGLITVNVTATLTNRFAPGEEIVREFNIAVKKRQITTVMDATNSHFKVGNPYIPLWTHVPDGETRVFEDPDNPGKYRAYLIGSHDLRNATYCGPDIVMWSAPIDDLNQWRFDGSLYTYRHPVSGQWANMFAPDLVEVMRFDPEIESGARPRTPEDKRTVKEYYMWPHPNNVIGRGITTKSITGRPEGPYEAVNLNASGAGLLPGSVIGFDPSVLIDYVDDPDDPDYNIGFRAYCYWGWQQAEAAELDQFTMWSVRPLGPGETEEEFPGRGRAYDFFIPVSSAFGTLRTTPANHTTPAARARWRIVDHEDAFMYNYFEAFAIRKVEIPDGNDKYLVIYSGYSGPEYGLGSTNSAMRYLYGDGPMGPWKMGGVIVDSRGPVPNQNGTALVGGAWGHNTHGGPWFINDQWYIAYHRPPRGGGGNRQPMVAPINIDLSNAGPKVADGGSLTIRAYDPYAEDGIWTAKGTNLINNTWFTNRPTEYTGAEITSEGFNIFGLPPYQYYSAGLVCDSQGGNTTGGGLTASNAIQDSWDTWDSHMPLNSVSNGSRFGYKYFGFGGLGEAKKGLQPFEGTAPGNNTMFNLWLTPRTASEVRIDVWLDGPWANDTWKGINMGQIVIPAGSVLNVTERFQLDVSEFVDHLTQKNAIYLVVNGGTGPLCNIIGLGFSSDKHEIERVVPPSVGIRVNDNPVTIPTSPIFYTDNNGIAFHTRYTVAGARPAGDVEITASSNDPNVKVMVTQPTATSGLAGAGLVRFFHNGVEKQYRLFHTFTNIAAGEADDVDVAFIQEADRLIGSKINVYDDGSADTGALAAKAKAKIDGMIAGLGVASELVYDPDLESYTIKLSRGATVLTVQNICVEVLEPVVVSVSNAKFISVSNLNRITTVKFTATVVLSDGKSEVRTFEFKVDANNNNIDGKYVFPATHDLAGFTLTYDIKGNGSNIKAFSIK